jgi:hypothetical protein
MGSPASVQGDRMIVAMSSALRTQWLWQRETK